MMQHVAALTPETSTVCIECGGGLREDYKEGQIVCTRCGLVNAEVIVSRGAEYRVYNFQERGRMRAGPPIQGFFSGKTGLWITGRLNPEEKERAHRLQRVNERYGAGRTKERAVNIASTELERMAYRLSLPAAVKDTATNLFLKAHKNGIVRGRSIESVMAACIYIACRKCGVVRSIGVVAENVGQDKKRIGKVYRVLQRKLELKIPRVDYRQHLSKLIKVLDVTSETERIAILLLEVAEAGRDTRGRSPSGMVSGIIYIAMKLSDTVISQHQIAIAAQCTEVTLRNRYKALLQAITIDMKM